MTHQTLSLEKYWKLFPATLKQLLKNYCVVLDMGQRTCWNEAELNAMLFLAGAIAKWYVASIEYFCPLAFEILVFGV